jgi:hypothetical protein
MCWFGAAAPARFAEALSRRRARREGLRDRDAVGSMDADEAMFEELSAAGRRPRVQPIAPWRHRFNIGQSRAMRKILVVDQRIGLTGRERRRPGSPVRRQAAGATTPSSGTAAPRGVYCTWRGSGPPLSPRMSDDLRGTHRSRGWPLRRVLTGHFRAARPRSGAPTSRSRARSHLRHERYFVPTASSAGRSAPRPRRAWTYACSCPAGGHRGLLCRTAPLRWLIDRGVSLYGGGHDPPQGRDVDDRWCRRHLQHGLPIVAIEPGVNVTVGPPASRTR